MHRSSNGFVSGRRADRLSIICVSMVALVGLGLPTASTAQTEPRTAQKLIFVAVPPERSLPIPPAQSTLSANSVVLQRISEAHAGSRLAQMDFVGEGTVTAQTDDRPLTFAVKILRNELRGQHIELKQPGGKSVNIGASSPDAIARRILDFLQTQHDRGLANLLQSESRNATVRDGGIKDGIQTLVVLETERIATRYVIDAELSRVVRFEFQRGQSPDPSGRILPNLESFVFSDFRRVNGLPTPFKVEHFVNGAKREELQFSSAQYVSANRDTTPRPMRGGLR